MDVMCRHVQGVVVMIVVICFAVVMPLVIVCVIVIATYRGFLQNPDQAFERTPYRPIVWDMWAKPSRGRSFERPIGFLKKTPRGLCPHVFAGLDPLRGSCGHGPPEGFAHVTHARGLT